MPKKTRATVDLDALAWEEEAEAQDALRVTEEQVKRTFKPYQPPEGVIGPGEEAMAMDEAPVFSANLTGAVNSSSTLQQLVHEGIGFPGYPYLSALLMRGEYQNIVHTLSREFFRNWGKFVTKGGKDDEKKKKPKIDALHNAMERYQVRETLKTLFEHDLVFGGGRCVVITNESDKDPAELQKALTLTSAKIGAGSLLRFRVVEPIWMTPTNYEATNPLNPWFYKPDSWWVLGQKIDASRIVEIVSRPLPDILKPAWNFGGIPLCLMAKPYVQNWLRTRQNVSDIIDTLRTTVITTDQADQTGGSRTRGGNLTRRIRLFQKLRDNFGILLLNLKETASNLTTPLSELAELQAQSLEQICSITNIPVVKFTANSPQGLNASSEGEIRTFYDTGKATRENVIEPAFRRMTDIIQLSEFGEIDPDLVWRWDSLFEETPVEKLDMEVKKAQIRESDIASGQISAEEGRDQIRGDEDSIYAASGLTLEGSGPDEYPNMPDNAGTLDDLKLPHAKKPSGEGDGS